MKHPKKFLLILVLCLALAIPAATKVSALSSYSVRMVGSSASTSDACNGLSQLGDTNCPQNGGNPQGKIGNLTASIVNIISYVAGAIAVIMIIIGGVKYTTSGGDAAKVGSAKTTLVYALVGIAIAALAQALVHLVLNQTNI